MRQAVQAVQDLVCFVIQQSPSPPRLALNRKQNRCQQNRCQTPQIPISIATRRFDSHRGSVFTGFQSITYAVHQSPHRDRLRRTCASKQNRRQTPQIPISIATRRFDSHRDPFYGLPINDLRRASAAASRSPPPHLC
jgi:hypothetical protein